jgi:osmotically-inducible protein OsmY
MIYMKRLLYLLLAAFLMAAGVSRLAAQPPAQIPAPVKHTEDDRIYDEVRRKLANDLDVKGAGIEVAVNHGEVTLSGNVHTEHGKEKAEKLTKKTKGVTSVVNHLAVQEAEK